MGPPASPAPRAHRAQALFWRARARALSAEAAEEQAYVMNLALKDLAEAVRLEPGDRAIRSVGVGGWVVICSLMGFL